MTLKSVDWFCSRGHSAIQLAASDHGENWRKIGASSAGFAAGASSLHYPLTWATLHQKWHVHFGIHLRSPSLQRCFWCTMTTSRQLFSLLRSHGTDFRSWASNITVLIQNSGSTVNLPQKLEWLWNARQQTLKSKIFWRFFLGLEKTSEWMTVR